MPWLEVSTVSLRQEFITLVQQKSVSVSELCRRCLQREMGTRLFFSACPHKGPDVGDHTVDIFVAQLLTERRHRLFPVLRDLFQVRIGELRHLLLISVVCGLF